MPTFIGSRENSLEDALTIGQHAGSNLAIRKYFTITDFDDYPDTDVLVTPVEDGIKVVLPDYKNTHILLSGNPGPDTIKKTATQLVTDTATQYI